MHVYRVFLDFLWNLQVHHPKQSHDTEVISQRLNLVLRTANPHRHFADNVRRLLEHQILVLLQPRGLQIYFLLGLVFRSLHRA